MKLVPKLTYYEHVVQTKIVLVASSPSNVNVLLDKIQEAMQKEHWEELKYLMH